MTNLRVALDQGYPAGPPVRFDACSLGRRENTTGFSGRIWQGCRGDPPRATEVVPVGGPFTVSGNPVEVTMQKA